jgi:hypothetical protein
MSKNQISEANKQLRNEKADDASTESKRFVSPRQRAEKGETIVEGNEDTDRTTDHREDR